MFCKGRPGHWTLARSRADNLWQELVSCVDGAEGGCHSETFLLDREMVVSSVIVHIKLCPWRRILPGHVFGLLGAVSEPLVVEALYLCVRFVKVLLGLPVAHGFSERLDGVELVHRVVVQLVHALEGLLAQSFLVVCEEEAPELLPREEVLALVLALRHGEDLRPLGGPVGLDRIELSSESHSGAPEFLVVFNAVFVKFVFEPIDPASLTHFLSL